MGTTRNYTKDVDLYVRRAAIDMAQLGVTGEIAYNSVFELSKALFSSMSVTPSLVRDVSLMSASLGIAAETSAQFVKTLAISDRTTASLSQNMLFFGAAMAQAAGVPLNAVMSDINASSKSSYQFLKKSGIELIKAAVEARRMGTSLEQTASSQSKLLDFTSSVNSEMKASVLLGQSFDLTRARQLAYTKDTIGLNKELVRLAKQANFEQLDPIQQQAVAEAMGKQASEVAEMLQASREQRNIEDAINGNDDLKRRSNELKAMANATRAQAKNWADIAKQQMLSENNQSRMNSIAASWHKIIMQLADHFLPVIDGTLGFIANNFDVLLSAAIPLVSYMKSFSLILESINTSVESFGVYKMLTGTSKMVRGIGDSIVYVTKKLSFLSKFIGEIKFVSTFAKVIPVVGEVIMAIQGIYYSVKKIIDIFNHFKDGDWQTGLIELAKLLPYIVWKVIVQPIGELLGSLGDFILKGIVGVESDIYKSITGVFGRIWNSISDFIGHSPSELGLSIVKGLEAVQSMLFNALVSPFKMAWDFIKQIPFVSRLFGNSNIIEPLNIQPDLNVTKVSALTNESSDKQNVNYGDKFNDMLMKKLTDVVDSINGLRADFASGKLRASVSMDGQKLDASTGRRLDFTGPLISA